MWFFKKRPPEDLPDVDLSLYRRFRAITLAHHNQIVQTIPKATLRKRAKTLQLLRGNELQLESESELTILMDYCIYSTSQSGQNLVQAYLAKLPADDDPDEQAVRAAMAKARFSMFRAERSIKGTGVKLRDLVRGDVVFVVDLLLSKTIRQSGLLGGRVLPFPNFWTTTGAGFPLSEEVVDSVERVFLPALKTTEGDLSSLRPDAEAELATVVIGAALHDGTTGGISYK